MILEFLQIYFKALSETFFGHAVITFDIKLKGPSSFHEEQEPSLINCTCYKMGDIRCVLYFFVCVHIELGLYAVRMRDMMYSIFKSIFILCHIRGHTKCKCCFVCRPKGAFQ